MRTRSLSLLAALAAVGLLASGCTADPADPNASHTPRADCLIDLPSGASSDAIGIEGSGAEVTITIPEGTAFTELERTVRSRGTGDDVSAGDLVSLNFTIVRADTGEVLDSTARGENGLLPMLLDTSDATIFVVALECLPLGSEVVFAVPAANRGEGASDLVVYAQAVEFLPTRAVGTAVAPVDGMPTVVLDDRGAPTIGIPNAAAPSETRVETLIKGAGAVVQPGDMVVVQYTGVKWDDGEVFESSWQRGAPSQFPTSGVVTGFRMALEGQSVGSQVLVVMPPSDGYGHVAGHRLEHHTLVFVVDILATSALEN